MTPFRSLSLTKKEKQMEKYVLQVWTGLKVISFTFDNWADAEANYRFMSGPKRLINQERNKIVDSYNWRF